jgi:hypothetical protein
MQNLSLRVRHLLQNDILLLVDAGYEQALQVQGSGISGPLL